MSKGRYGVHGGQYIAETLMNEILRLEEAYEHYKADPDFNAELNTLLKEYAGRPSLLYYAQKMTQDLGGAKIYLKREDLNHTGSHKTTTCWGRRCWPRRWEKPGSSRKPARASTAWPPPRRRPCWGWNARFSWARRTPSARP